MSEYLTPQQMALMVGGGITAATIRDHIETGRIQAHARYSASGKQRQWMILRSEAEAYIAEGGRPKAKVDEPRGRPCPECHGSSEVTHIRQENKGAIRLRKCRNCGHRWRTIETTYTSQHATR